MGRQAHDEQKIWDTKQFESIQPIKLSYQIITVSKKQAFTCLYLPTPTPNNPNQHYIPHDVTIVSLIQIDDQYPQAASSALTELISLRLSALRTLFALANLFLCHAEALYLRLFYNFSTKACLPQPTWLERSPRVQNFLKLDNLTALKASGTTSLFFVSQGAGTPSKIFSLPSASAPLGDL